MVTQDALDRLIQNAWRGGYTEPEFAASVELIRPCDEGTVIGKLLFRATYSDVPNRLLFDYIQYFASNKIVSVSVLLDEVTKCQKWDAPLCATCILRLISVALDGLSGQELEPDDFVASVAKVADYLSLGLTCGDALPALVQLLDQMGRDWRVTYSLWFAHLEDPEHIAEIAKRFADAVPEIVSPPSVAYKVSTDTARAAIQRFADMLQSLPTLTELVPNEAACTDDGMTPIVSAVSLFGTRRFAESISNAVHIFDMIRRVKELSWCQVFTGILRGAFLLQLETWAHLQESSLAAFTYLQIPRILKALAACDNEAGSELYAALEILIRREFTLLCRADMKTRVNCVKCFLGELLKQQLVTQSQIEALEEMHATQRTTQRGYFMEQPADTAQASTHLVLKAEPTFQTLLRSFYSDFARNPEKLVQMMHHMITGKSYEYICAAAAATGCLYRFVRKLVEFNESTGPSGCALFDLSSLLISRILQLHGDSFLSDAEGEDVERCRSKALFRIWKSGHDIKEIYDDTANATADAQELYTALTSTDPDPATGSVPAMTWCAAGDWHTYVLQMAPLAALLMEKYRQGTMSADELANVASGLSNNVCILMFGLARCLSLRYELARSGENQDAAAMAATKLDVDAIRRLSHDLQNYLIATQNSYNLAGAVPPDQKPFLDRFTFMSLMTRKLIEPITAIQIVPVAPVLGLPVLGAMPQSGMALSADMYPDVLRRLWHDSLQRRFLRPMTLQLLEKGFTLPDGANVCARVWLEELASSDTPREGMELILALVYLNPEETARPFVDAVFGCLTESYALCAPPKGDLLASLVVAILLRVNQSADEGRSQQPQRKKQKIMNDVEVLVCEHLKRVTARDGLEPFVDWAYHLLESWAEHAAVLSPVGHQLVSQVVMRRRLASPKTIVNLYDTSTVTGRSEAKEALFRLNRVQNEFHFEETRLGLL